MPVVGPARRIAKATRALPERYPSVEIVLQVLGTEALLGFGSDDLNPTPVDLRPRILSTAISLDDGSWIPKSPDLLAGQRVTVIERSDGTVQARHAGKLCR